MKKRLILKTTIIATVFMLAGISSMMATSIVPDLYDHWQSGNAQYECEEAGGCGAFAWKIEGYENGEYDTNSNEFDNDPILPPNNAIITICNSDGQMFDWSSDQPVCSVIVKGGKGANVYSYDPPAYSDTGLTAPENPKNGKLYDISHITFCWNTRGTITWPESGTVSIAFEDIPLDKRNDWDYNDFVMDIGTIGTTYNGKLTELNFTFHPEAKLAGYNHTQNFSIPADTFGSNGMYEMQRDGITIASGMYYYDQDFDITLIENTNSYPTKITLNFTFDSAFDFTFPEWIGSNYHGENLFFDPYIMVIQTGEEIKTGDVRMLTVPIDWQWQTPDGNSLWNTYYPKVMEGMNPGDPPQFSPNWWE